MSKRLSALAAVMVLTLPVSPHYFWTALEQRVLQEDPARGPGFWFVTINRSRSDGLSGFIGRMIRGRVRGEAQKGSEALLRVTKAALERQ